MYILGINAFLHDSAAALVGPDGIIACAEEERFDRIKHSFAYPRYSVDYCLREAGIELDQVTHVAFFWNPYYELIHKFPPFVKVVLLASIISSWRITCERAIVLLQSNF